MIFVLFTISSMNVEAFCFNVNYVLDISAMNYPTYPCNEAMDNVTDACSCMDCKASCPKPIVYPPEKKPWKIYGIYGYMVIVAGIYLAFTILFLGIMELYSATRGKKQVNKEVKFRAFELITDIHFIHTSLRQHFQIIHGKNCFRLKRSLFHSCAQTRLCAPD